VLQPDEEARLARRARNGDARAFERLVLSHVRLAVHTARQFAARGFQHDELLNEALLGLVEAARRFDPDKGARLATYALFWMRAYVRRFATNNRLMVKAPATRKARTVLSNLRSAQRQLACGSAEEPSTDRVAELLGVDAADVEEINALLSAQDAPLEDFVVHESGALPADERSPEICFAEAESSQLDAKAVREALSKLSEREQEVLLRHQLVDDGESLAAIGSSFGVSRERVRQIEQQAHQKLRRVLKDVAA
jgi:RNA polymerase sigma-32 factor